MAQPAFRRLGAVSQAQYRTYARHVSARAAYGALVDMTDLSRDRTPPRGRPRAELLLVSVSYWLISGLSNNLLWILHCFGALFSHTLLCAKDPGGSESRY